MYQLQTLASIVQVGEEACKELLAAEHPMFNHRYLRDMRGRLRTKLVQMQCEIESHDPKFPFEFYHRDFMFYHSVPELRTKQVIMHLGRSKNPETLPYESRYKVQLSFNNHPIQRQLVINPGNNPPYSDGPFYAILTFGGRNQPFSVIQFPEPGYAGIAETISLPPMVEESEKKKTVERKKAVLKEEFLYSSKEDVI